MRKVYYGVFVDFYPPSYGDCDMIGARIYIARARRVAYATAGYEYYIYDEKRHSYVPIDDATVMERLSARIKHLFKLHKKEIIGCRPEKHDPYDTNNPQLGLKVDENGNKQVDEQYYNEAVKREAEKGNHEMVKAAEAKREEAHNYILNGTEQNEDNTKICTKEKSHEIPGYILSSVEEVDGYTVRHYEKIDNGEEPEYILESVEDRGEYKLSHMVRNPNYAKTLKRKL